MNAEKLDIWEIATPRSKDKELQVIPDSDNTSGRVLLENFTTLALWGPWLYNHHG